MKDLFDEVRILGLADHYGFVGGVDGGMDAAAMYKTEVEAAGHVFQGSNSSVGSSLAASARGCSARCLPGGKSDSPEANS